MSQQFVFYIYFARGCICAFVWATAQVRSQRTTYSWFSPSIMQAARMKLRLLTGKHLHLMNYHLDGYKGDGL